MEAFESFIALALEDEGFVVSGAVKFPVVITTKKQAYTESQKHGFEVDLVGARADRLVLATVKSFFGSGGVRSEHVTGTSDSERGNKLYALLYNKTIRRKVIKEAVSRYGYRTSQVELRLYVGRFAAPVQGHHREAIERWAARQRVGAGPIKVYGVDQVVDRVRAVSARKQYRDDPAIVAIKVLEAAGELKPLDLDSGP